MESNRGYNEPELQKMAAFLRERCEKGLYGLTYADPQKKLIRIPWHTVPRQNEDVSDNFGLFTEWAYLSHRKRGNRSDHTENEPLSQQKHRFRNALARADGLRYCKQLSSETMRVYEFTDTRKERDRGENAAQRQERCSPPNYREQKPLTYLPYSQMHPGDFSDHSQMGSEWDPSSPITPTITSSPCQTPGYAEPGAFQLPPDEISQAAMQEDSPASFTGLLDELLNVPDNIQQLYPQNEANYQYTYTVPETVKPGEIATPTRNYQVVQRNSALRYMASGQSNGVMLQQPEQGVVIKVYFRGELVMEKPIFKHSTSFRLYSGHNVPDMSRLLDGAQRSQLEKLTKYCSDVLFGPESLEQVALPGIGEIQPGILSDQQCFRTKQILDNMDRGLVFWVENGPNDGIPYNSSSIPNIYGIRLCQTRVFPYGTNVPERAQLEEGGLKRMMWTKIFDGSEFLRQMQGWINGTCQSPSSVINLSVGQKPKRDTSDSNLVSVTFSVNSAKLALERYFEEQMIEICISDKNSMDKAAQDMKNQIQQSIRIDDSVYKS